VNPYELVLTHIFTLAVVDLSAYLFVQLFRRYRENGMLPSLFLSLYFLVFSIHYLFTFLLRFPTETKNLAVVTAIIPLGAFLPHAFHSLLGALFASFTLSRKKSRLLALPIVAAALFSAALVALNPPVMSLGPGGIPEWVLPPGAHVAMWIDLSLSLLVVLYLTVYTIVIEGKRDKAKGAMISVAFAALTYLTLYADPAGSSGMIYIRRVAALLALVLLYLGFIMPNWLVKRLDL